MKKFMYVCMYILFATSLYAQQGHGRQRRIEPKSTCSVNAMLKSADHGNWENPACLRALATYLKPLSVEQKNQIGPIVVAGARHARDQYHALSQKTNGQQAADDFLDAYNACMHAYNPDNPCLCHNPKRGYYKCPPHECGIGSKSAVNKNQVGSNTSLEVAVSKKVDEQTSNQTRLLSNLTQAEYAELVKNAPDGQMMPEKFKRLAEKVQRAADNHEDLSKFIEVVVQGSSDPKDSRYVPTEVINLAFMQYASSLAPTESTKLTQYTNDKYSGRVRYAAASAAAEYAYSSFTPNGAEKVNTTPNGHLKLSLDQRQIILDVFKEVYYSLDKNEPSLGVFFKVLKLRTARVFDGIVWADDLEAPTSQTKQAGALVLAVPVVGKVATRIGLQALVEEGLALAAEGMAGAEYAAIGAAPTVATATGGAVVVGGILYYSNEALNDAFTPMWKQQWMDQLDLALAGTDTLQNSVGTIVLDGPIMHNEEELAAYGLASPAIPRVKSQAKTKTQTKRNVCVYLGVSSEIVPDTSRTDAGSGVLSNSALRNPKFILLGDSITYEHWNERMSPYELALDESWWRSVTSDMWAKGITRGECIRKNLSPQCAKEREQLQRLYNKRNSFVGGSTSASGSSIPTRKLYARAVWRNRVGRWVLNVENADGHEINEGFRPENIDRSVDDALNDSFDEFTAEYLRNLLKGVSADFSNRLRAGGYYHINIRDGVHDVNNPVANHFHVEQACVYNPNGGQQICEFGQKHAVLGEEYYICNLAVYHNPVQRY